MWTEKFLAMFKTWISQACSQIRCASIIFRKDLTKLKIHLPHNLKWLFQRRNNLMRAPKQMKAIPHKTLRLLGLPEGAIRNSLSE